MKILSIETSCDETAMAVVVAKNKNIQVLSHVVASQAKLHAKYGGVYPTLAKRQHQKNLPIILKKVNAKEINAIAITVGPGLDPCLWAGIEFAKALATEWGVPIIPTNHIEGHLVISLLASNLVGTSFTGFTKLVPTKFTPAVALIVSGGHTQLILVKGIGKYRILGETRDDAAGECFDKTARILGLGYPGGPILAKLAALPRPGLGRHPRPGLGILEITLPRPMLHTKDYDFSFSGLKTAVLYDYQSRRPKVRKSKEYIRAMAREIQQSIIDVLVAKTLAAAQEHGAQSVVLGGGVAANRELRRQLGLGLKRAGYKLLAAAPELCTDNGLMIALAGYLHKDKQTKKYERIVSKPNLTL